MGGGRLGGRGRMPYGDARRMPSAALAGVRPWAAPLPAQLTAARRVAGPPRAVHGTAHWWGKAPIPV